MDEITASLMSPFNLRDWLTQGQTHLSKFTHLSSYSKLTWVFACINRIANSVANVPRSLQRNGKPILADHPLWIYFNPPYGKTIPSFNHLVKLSVIQREIFGGTHWIFDSKKSQVLPVWDGAITPKVMPGTNELAGWEYSDGRIKKNYRLDEVFWWRYPHPTSLLSSMPPLDAARWAVEQEINQSAWNAKSFKKGLTSRLLCYSEDGMTKTQKDQIIKDVEAQSTGSVGSEFTVLSGKFKIEKLSQSLKDMEYIQGRQMTREEICAVFQVPPALVGIYQYANYANADFQGQEFWQHKIMPYLVDLKETLDIHFQQMGFDVEVEYDKKYYIDFLKPLKDRTESAKKLVEIGVPVQQALDAAEIDIVVPEGTAPMAAPSQEPESPTGPLPEEEEVGSKTAPTVGEQDLNEYSWNYLEAMILPAANSYMKVFRRQIMRQVRRGDEFSILYDMWSDKLAETVEPFVSDFLVAGWNVARALLGKCNGETFVKQPTTMFDPPGMSPDVWRVEIQPVTRELAASFSHVTDTMAKEIEMRVWESVARGDNLTQIELQIGDILTDPKWARRITRSTVGGSYNMGKYIGYLKEGTTHHKWISMHDGKERVTHKLEHGNIVPVRQMFPVTGLRFPHDPQGPKREIYNCRCTTVPVTGKKPSSQLEQWFSSKAVLSSILDTVRTAYYSFEVGGWKLGKKMAWSKVKGAGSELADNLRTVLTGRVAATPKMAVTGNFRKAIKGDLSRVAGILGKLEKILAPLCVPGVEIKWDLTQAPVCEYRGGKILLPLTQVDRIVEMVERGDFSYQGDPWNYLGQIFFCLGLLTEAKFFAAEMDEYYQSRIGSQMLTPEQATGFEQAAVVCPDHDFALPYLGFRQDGLTSLTGHVFAAIGLCLCNEKADMDLGTWFLRDSGTYVKIMTMVGGLFDEGAN